MEINFFFLFFSFSSTHVGKPNTIPLSLFLIFPVFLSLYSASSLKPRAEKAKGKWRELNASLTLLQHGEKRKRERGRGGFSTGVVDIFMTGVSRAVWPGIKNPRGFFCCTMERGNLRDRGLLFSWKSFSPLFPFSYPRW